MDTIEITGGARIGSANATWPFAKLKVDKNVLELNASIIGNLVFRPRDIISITPYSSVLSNGIKINHKVAEYKTDVIFWTTTDPTLIINQIKQTGFTQNISNDITVVDKEIADKQKSGSNPLKKSTVIVYAVLWNVLLIFDFIRFALSGMKGMPLSYGTVTVLLIFLLSSILLLTSEQFRRLLLKKGRTGSDVGRFLYLVIFVCLFMLTIISLMNAIP
jgi:hypothetical protein